MRIWIKERLLLAGQGNENERDHIFVGPFISWILVEKSDHCRENNEWRNGGRKLWSVWETENISKKIWSEEERILQVL